MGWVGRRRRLYGVKFKFTSSSQDGRPCWRVEGVLADKVARWKEEEQREREQEEQRLRGSRWEDDSMEVDDEEDMHVDGESTEDEDDSEEIRKLKVSIPILRALTMTQRMLTIHLTRLGAPTVSADASRERPARAASASPWMMPCRRWRHLTSIKSSHQLRHQLGM